MFHYFCVFLCFILFNSAIAHPKYFPHPVQSNQIEKNLVKQYNASSELEVTQHSKLLQAIEEVFHVPSSDIKPRNLKLEKVRDEKDEPQTQIVEHRMDLEKVIKEIRSHHFNEAEIILRKMDLSDKIPEIVHNVYNNSKANIDLLVDFGRDLTNPGLANTVLFALWDEMKANGHRDVHKMINLINAIEFQLTILKGSPKWKAKADETIFDITSASVEILKAAMISANNRNSTQVKLLAESVLKPDQNNKLFDKLIQKVANESFAEVTAVEIAQNLYNRAFLSQAIAGVQNLFEKLEKANNLNSPAMLSIGEYLKNVKSMPNYINLDKSHKEAVDKMIHKMPMCARNLFFEPFVCIWNKGKSEYLYVAGSEFNRNEDKRSVFTRTTREAVGPGIWIVEKSGDQFFFRNKAYENEYLFAASGMHNKDSRFVHTWTEGGKVGNKSSWTIELEGNVCYLRNVNYDEYLFASDRQSGDKSRYAFTWIPKTSTKEANFQWEIRSCDLSEILKKSV